MKIISLKAENIKKLEAVEIVPVGNLVQITGKNGQGKTSVLDCIWWALAGAANIQDAPIRKGMDQARIRLDLGEIVVTRKFKDKEGEAISTITVESADGAKYGSPQVMLDKLLGELTFDPLAFSRMDSKGQYDTLRKFVSDVDFDAIDRANKGDFDRRTELNRSAKESRLMAEKITVEDGPLEPQSDADLIQQIADAGTVNADINRRAENRKNAPTMIKEKMDSAATLQEEARALEEEATALEASAKTKWDAAIKKRNDAQVLVLGGEDLQKRVIEAEKNPLPPLEDTAALQAKVEAVRSANQKVAQRKEKQSYADQAAQAEKQAAELTAAMAKRNADRDEAISKVKLPVEAVTFGEGRILMNGVPFEQASDAEQLRASIAIAMALNPQLKVIRVRDGSLLDEDSLALLAKMAIEKDYQVWIERVDGSGKVGFVLEDGHVKQAETAQPVAAPQVAL